MRDEKRIRLNLEQRRLIIRALLQVARGDSQSVWECWLICRSLAEEVRGKRPHWQGKKENEMMVRDMEAWSEGRMREAAPPSPQTYSVVGGEGEVQR
jgi:hypothetical protein